MLCYAQPGSSPNRCYCLSVNSHFAWIDSYICRQYGFSYRPQFIWSLICLQTGLSYYCLVSLPTFGSELQYPWLIFLLNYFCLTTFGSLESCMSVDRLTLLLSYFAPHLQQRAPIPMVNFLIKLFLPHHLRRFGISYVCRQAFLITVLFHSPPLPACFNTHPYFFYYFFSLLFIQTDYPYYCLISRPTFGRELQYISFFITPLDSVLYI